MKESTHTAVVETAGRGARQHTRVEALYLEMLSNLSATYAAVIRRAREPRQAAGGRK